MAPNISPTVSQRLISIDALRGIVMLLMLMDHVRETIFLHLQVGDPVDAAITSPTLFFTRLTSAFCAPAFIALTGLSAWLYGQHRPLGQTSSFLLKRGLFLIALELVVIGTAWTGVFPPEKLYLQVIWCIGICMVSLAALIHLPRIAQIIIGLMLVTLHHLLEPIVLDESSPFHTLWAIMYQRDWIDFFGIPARTSYPVLPWIGVILLGYTIAPWFSSSVSADTRRKRLTILGGVMFVAFILLRTINLYGDHNWTVQETVLRNIMGFFSLTKYPPSLLFLLFTLSFSAFALVIYEKTTPGKWTKILTTFGSAPMFFYVVHLYVLKAIYLTLVSIYGTNQGDYFGVDHIQIVWLSSITLAFPMVYLTCKFSRFKQQNKQIKILKYL